LEWRRLRRTIGSQRKVAGYLGIAERTVRAFETEVDPPRWYRVSLRALAIEASLGRLQPAQEAQQA
ncbi:MAG TPA: hypothetical protein VNX15_02505, partial [Gemmatimonadales bacterium]|nr:hypothetical protein [Gemmatimonadales bacterium]